MLKCCFGPGRVAVLERWLPNRVTISWEYDTGKVVQWNLSKTATCGPVRIGLCIEVTALQK